ADQGTARDFGLILGGDLGLWDGAAAPRASVRQEGLKDFINRRGAGRRAVAVTAVGRAGFAAGSRGLGLGRPLGEGRGLAFGLAVGLVEAGTGLCEFASEAFVLLAESLDFGAELLQFLQDGEGYGHRVEHLD